MLTAYFDETGVHKGARVTAMSGFIAKGADWANVETKWRARLDEDPPEFRAKDFHAVDCEHGRGEFNDPIYWDQPRRDQLQEGIGKYSSVSFSYIVPVFARYLLPMGNGFLPEDRTHKNALTGAQTDRETTADHASFGSRHVRSAFEFTSSPVISGSRIE